MGCHSRSPCAFKKIPLTQCLFLNSECFHSSPCFISSCLSLLWWKWMADPPSLPGVKAMVVGVLRVHHKSACAGFVGVSPRDVPAPSLHLPFLSMSHAGVSVLGAVNEGSASFLCKLLLEIIHWKSSRSLSYPQSSKILVEFFFSNTASWWRHFVVVHCFKGSQKLNHDLLFFSDYLRNSLGVSG